MTDWRLSFCGSLKGMRFRRKPYRRWSETWDHDHCAACWAEFSESDGPNIQHEGYASCEDAKHKADYDWVCVPCFNDLREIMDWSETAD